jgi:DNA-binding MarR family transcriptional regulator
VGQGELARRLRLTKSTVSRLVDQLADKGWVERRALPGDGRRRAVVLTEKGSVVAGDVAGRRAERMARLLDRIPEGERATVLAALDTLVEAARED